MKAYTRQGKTAASFVGFLLLQPEPSHAKNPGNKCMNILRTLHQFDTTSNPPLPISAPPVIHTQAMAEESSRRVPHPLCWPTPLSHPHTHPLTPTVNPHQAIQPQESSFPFLSPSVLPFLFLSRGCQIKETPDILARSRRLHVSPIGWMGTSWMGGLEFSCVAFTF